MLIYAIVAVNLALLFYTLGVWGVRLQGGLKKWHVLMLWVGFVFDTTGTILMIGLSKNPLTLNFHALTGFLAMALMLGNAVWATKVMKQNRAGQKRNFYRFGILVWVVWLIPYFSGAIAGMVR